MGLITEFLKHSYDLTFGIAIPIAFVMSVTEYLWSLEKRIEIIEENVDCDGPEDLSEAHEDENSEDA